MSDLPGDLAGPLHILVHLALLIRVLTWLGIALLVIWLVRRWWPKHSPAPIGESDPVKRERGGRASIREIVLGLREKYGRTRRFRLGCHELSMTLRRRLEATSRQPVTNMTTREIRRALGKTPTSRLLQELAELQFGREEPDARHFEEVCDRAIKAFKRRSVRGPR